MYQSGSFSLMVFMVLKIIPVHHHHVIVPVGLLERAGEEGQSTEADSDVKAHRNPAS